ncbi:MAG: AraC family transcriptional regulator ligand-binding domain-containing protein, partial [Gammaproteobacteria bacterium]
MSSTVRVAGLRDLPAIVQRLGGDPLQICRECGVDPALFEDDDALIPFRKVVHLMEHAALTLGVPDLGLRLAAVWKLDILGPL